MTRRVHCKPLNHRGIHRGISRHILATTDDVNLVTYLRCLQWLAASVERSMVVHYFIRRETACGIARPYNFQPPYQHTSNPMLVTCESCRKAISKNQERIIQFARDHGIHV